MELARREGYMFGAKLVRGAYMEQERLRASTLGYTDPIHPSYKATSKCFNEVLNAVLEETKRGNANVLVATHNEDSIQVAIKRYIESRQNIAHFFQRVFVNSACFFKPLTGLTAFHSFQESTHRSCRSIFR